MADDITTAQVVAQNAPKKPRKAKLNLATAKVADGALATPKSVYEICGIRDGRYGGTKNVGDYERSLAKMDLIELQDEAYNKGVTPNQNRDIIIERLVRGFLQERSASRMPDAGSPDTGASEELREQARKVLARGR